MILKTYARLFVRSLDESLPLYEKLAEQSADLRFPFEDAELAAVGDFLLIAGTEEATSKYRDTAGPVIVDDLRETTTHLGELGAIVTAGPFDGPTGTFLYVRHPDGTNVEYVQWTDELRSRIVGG